MGIFRYIGRGVPCSMGTVPKALCSNMVEIYQDSHQQANQNYQKTSCFNKIKALPG